MNETPTRARIDIRGAVQGVGFRPFVYRLATALGLTGWVINDSRGVRIEIEGRRPQVEEFLHRVGAEAPPLAMVHSIDHSWRPASGSAEFSIRQSEEAGAKTVVMLPDVATCEDCLREILDHDDRRFEYPFTNCTNCGPRFSIIRDLPYDRPNTTMREFEMCTDCQREYGDPLDRRFHAQPNACPVCGPSLELWNDSGRTLASGHGALEQTAADIAAGLVIAAKGLGGFHLLVDARSSQAVETLRARKGRYEKPLAIMARDLDMVAGFCHVDSAERDLLTTPQAPIVLLVQRSDQPLAATLAPGNPRLGVMLPYTPLHHLLLRRLDFPVVATSGNLSDEPICIGNREALSRLATIADRFLVHDRAIERHVDDSVVHRVDGDLQPIRRARGFAPMPLKLPLGGPTVLAVGGHLKNVIALAVDDRIFLSQHIGDMETPQAFDAFERVIRDFIEVYDAAPEIVAHDLHPDYPSTGWALEDVRSEGANWRRLLSGKRRVAVQHHHAHLASCLAEHRHESTALGVTWDGTGYGTDGTIWGGEFLLGDAASFRRVAQLRSFRLPGGEAAVKEPRRVALSLLWEAWGEEALERSDLAPIRSFEDSQRRPLASMLAQGVNAPITSSAGRLFDGIAALLDLRQRVSFEGQAAMALEFIARTTEDGSYPLALRPADDGSERLIIDWQPMLEAVLLDSQRRVDPGIIAARFHNFLVDAIVAVAEHIGERTVALTGGCFQNRLLSERAASRLRESGLDVLMHRRVPANDGGISFGQAVVARASSSGSASR